MIEFTYLAILLFLLVCMALCDWRWKLSFFLHPRRTAVLSVVVVAAFLAWDGLGIVTGTFFRGDTPYMTGVLLAPELPLEELFFLFFLTYLTINLTSGTRLLLDARSTPGRPS
ncbi:lycopene cyclase domain-containing protein [Corynebacterium lemuris]|uniref:lycopene cyclase domain-containing protein n=1 Tax=Corynebacterium lemuris TaxID=1859292 RepID=UPI0034E2DF15